MDELREEIKGIVARHCDEPNHREAVLRALARPGFALHPEADCRAGVLTYHVYQAIRNSPGFVATQVAAAVELQLEASFMLDHVADRELDPQQSPNSAEELALAITVLTCGSAAACEAVRQSGLDPSRLCALLEFHRNGISACGGQYLDVCMERQMSATTDEALQMTARKAGSLGRLAGDFGARVATHDSEVISLFGEFGFNLFTYLQLIDDMRDACPRNSPQSDLAQHKKSVPLVFFYNSLVNGHPEATSGMMLPPLVAECEWRRDNVPPGRLKS